MIVDPRADHVRVLFVVVGSRGLTKGLHVARVEADVISGEGGVPPKHVLAPQVRVHPAFVHRSIRLEMLFNVQLVLLQSELNIFLVGIGSHNSVEVLSDAVLLVIETIVVGSANCVDVLGHELADHTPIIHIQSVSFHPVNNHKWYHFLTSSWLRTD